MNKKLAQTMIVVCIPLVMAVCSEAGGVEENNISDDPCIEPVQYDRVPRKEQAESFDKQVENYRNCIAENVDIHNQSIKEHRQKMTALLVKWRVFAESCNDSKSCLFKLKKVTAKPSAQTIEGVRVVEKAGITVPKTDRN